MKTLIKFARIGLGAGLVTLLAPTVRADAPANYYNTVNTGDRFVLRSTLHNVIANGHTMIPYTAGGTDTWNVLAAAQQDPLNSANVVDVYRNRSFVKATGGNSFYDREHTWPKNHGVGYNEGEKQHTDCHQLFVSDSGYNSTRSDIPFGLCTSGCSTLATDTYNGQGGPSFPNLFSASGLGRFQVWASRRGDVARALLYMDVRYAGGADGPDLRLTNVDSKIQDTMNQTADGSPTPAIGYSGFLSTLVQWHSEDPVDQRDRDRNDSVFGFQHNRNPFVDHPEWVAPIFQCTTAAECDDGLFCNGPELCINGTCEPPTPPCSAGQCNETTNSCAGGGCTSAAQCDDGLFCNGSEQCVNSACTAGTAPCAAAQCNEGTDSCTSGCTSAAQCSDGRFCNGAEQCVNNACVAGSTPCGAAQCNETADSCSTSSGQPWINELHYDNDGADSGEFVEVAGPAGLSLAGWTLVGYNGASSVLAPYQTVALSGSLPNQSGCTGTLPFAFLGLQNGAPDGIALVNPSSQVVQFLSYEGSFTATSGPASGRTSVDIGVSEADAASNPAGRSLQLSGRGASAASFTWQGSQPATSGQPNTGQTFEGCAVTPPAVPLSPDSSRIWILVGLGLALVGLGYAATRPH
jgi:endonuclease I